MSDLRFLSIKEIHDGFDEKKFTPTDLVNELLSAIDKSETNSVLRPLKDRSLEQAKMGDQILKTQGKVPRSETPLFGIPIGVKDLLTIDGVETTCASKMLEGYIPPYTSTAVKRLESAGAISIAKLNMDEFAMGSSNENSAYGPVKHPTHPDHVPGGSSGGSAAAVREGLCTVALGTDTGGSIRLPASFCGVVGIKPTYGRVSRYGLVAFASSLDQIGPLSRSVEDSVRVLDVMAGHDPRDSTSAPLLKGNWLKSLSGAESLKGLKIGVPSEYMGEGLTDGVRNSVDAAFEWLRSQGATIKTMSLPHTDYAVATYYIVAVSEASSNLSRFDGVRFGKRPKSADQVDKLEDFYKTVRANFGAEVKRRIILGTYSLSSGYYDAYYKRACQVRNLIKQDFDHAFKEVDVIMGPVSPNTAFRIGEKSADPLQMYLNDIMTIPASLAGLPAMSLPCGADEKGLPIGLQIIGKHFEEEMLFSVASAFETSKLGEEK